MTETAFRTRGTPGEPWLMLSSRTATLTHAPQPVSALFPGVAVVAALAVLSLAVNRVLPLVSALLVAIVLGAVAGNLRPIPARWRPGLGLASKHLLRFGIVLLGLQVSVGTLAALGWQRLVLAGVVVAGGVACTMVLGRRMGVPFRMTALIACGFSICGAAAVAGARDVLEADEEETGTALMLVVVFGTLSIPVVPALAGLLGLSTEATATWIGASVHEVAQVVAAAAVVGPAALGTAVVVKLARVVCLAGVMAVLGVIVRRSAPPPASGRRPPLVPRFVLGFLAMVAVGSTPVPQPVLDFAGMVQSAALCMAMAALGVGIQFRGLREVGLKPGLLGLAATLVVSNIALGGVLLIG